MERMSTRARNTIYANGCKTFKDVGRLTLHQLLSTKNCGVKTAIEIMAKYAGPGFLVQLRRHYSRRQAGGRK